MKKLVGLFCALFIIVTFMSCGNQPPETQPEPEQPDEMYIEEEKKEIEVEATVEESKEIEVEETVEESQLAESTTPVEPISKAPVVSYVAYDYMGLSHKAVITDPAMLARIMDCFNYPGVGTDSFNPGMGGASGLIIEKDGVVKEYMVKFIFDGDEEVYAEGKFEDGKYYYIKDKKLVRDLHDTYYNDNYRAEPPYSFALNIIYFYMDYIDDSLVIQGEEGRAAIQPSIDMERFKKVIESSTPYTGPINDPEKVGGEGIIIETIEVREYRVYYLYKLSDGTVVCRLGGGQSDGEFPEDNNFYVVSDGEVYGYIMSTYFPGLKPQYNVKSGLK